MGKNYLLISAGLSLLILITSLYGIINTSAYPAETANWAAQSRAQDWINLVVAIPILLASAILSYKKSVAGYLIWLGSLVFLIYSFVIYAFLVRFNSMFLLYITILGISIYMLIFSLSNNNFSKIKESLSLNVLSKKFVSSFLIFLGALFYLVWLKDIIPNLLNNKIPPSITETGLPTNGVYVIDLAILLPGLIFAGYYLKKEKAIGYVLSGLFLPFCLMMMINIAFIVYYLGVNGLPTDNSVVIIFGFLSLITFALNVVFYKNSWHKKYNSTNNST